MNHRRWSGMLPRHADDPPPSPPPRSLDVIPFFCLSLFLFLSISRSPSLSRSGLRALDLPTSGTHPVPCHYVVISDNERVSANSLLFAYLRSKAATGREASFVGNLAPNITSELLAAPTDRLFRFKVARKQIVIQADRDVRIEISIRQIYHL